MGTTTFTSNLDHFEEFDMSTLPPKYQTAPTVKNALNVPDYRAFFENLVNLLRERREADQLDRRGHSAAQAQAGKDHLIAFRATNAQAVTVRIVNALVEFMTRPRPVSPETREATLPLGTHISNNLGLVAKDLLSVALVQDAGGDETTYRESRRYYMDKVAERLMDIVREQRRPGEAPETMPKPDHSDPSGYAVECRQRLLAVVHLEEKSKG